MMAEEELNYVTVKFKSHNDAVIYEDVWSSHEPPAPHHIIQEKPGDVEEIYDDVRTKEKESDPRHIFQDNVEKVALHSPLNLAAAGLGIVCIILVSVIVALTLHLQGVMSAQQQENANLTAENQQLLAQVAQLQGRAQELSRERDSLNWTMGVILEYDVFPVIGHCSNKVLALCKPCMEGWQLFHSKCYLFIHSDYYYEWKNWQGSVDECRQRNAELLVINSQEEQEFVTNHTRKYNDDRHGYWMGLSKNDKTYQWVWLHGENLTVTFWRSQVFSSRANCALSQPSDSLMNWSKESCEMRNRFICQTDALFKRD
uniref:oxidized low-density lipoprotein receptor 1-like isoform X1 n=1 Tax=Doryrhamphus excisus TaxID=161450 RepID=UPI0025AE563C|nr:oxidized low-density lipoprotein receptor 1-like isoform X1 [Doryrhamphus excisus]XP_057909830.1 oxidized low-density lipoprotein receptor 1-like isoform X1 [Doryrhamphus excisus]XP_057909831.1 oxidized low-density lipoprotein receptor 1-like isoform X1 [Doryrhamphus excisus]